MHIFRLNNLICQSILCNQIIICILGITESCEMKININEEKYIPLHMTHPLTTIKVLKNK